MLKAFYEPFHATVEETLANAGRPTRERILGKDPQSGQTVLTRMTRLGPVVQIGAQEELKEGEKPRYANLQPGQSMETITYEEAMRLFALPKTLGNYKGEEVAVGVGRYGPYVRYGEKFISIPRGEDPLSVTLERAAELIRAKQEEDAPVATYKGLPVTKGKGRFGPFLKWNDLYVNIPRRYNFDQITPEQAHELIEQKLEKEANRFIQKWEDEKIAIENGRWGAFIRFKKKIIKLPKIDGEKVTPEMAKELTLEQVKEFILAEIPDAFGKAKTKAKKK